MSYLRVKNLRKKFGKKEALHPVDFAFDEGKFYVILGPSGSGKSTFLNLIAGLEEQTQGRIYLKNKEITDLPPAKRNIAMVFQNYALYPHLTVYENLAFGMRARRESEETVRKAVENACQILNLKDKVQEYPRNLSGGEQQRVATGRAIVRKPDLFLFDEPLSNLDAQLRLHMRTELIKLHRKLQKTTLYVTHDQEEAMALGDEVMLLKEGRIQQVSPPDVLYRHPKNLFVAQFMGTPPLNVFEARITKQGLELGGGLAFPLSEQLIKKLRHQGKVFVGIRPQYVFFAEAGMKGEVIYCENLGKEAYVHVRIGTMDFTVKHDLEHLPEQGTAVRLQIKEKKTLFFDQQGDRILIDF